MLFMYLAEIFNIQSLVELGSYLKKLLIYHLTLPTVCFASIVIHYVRSIPGTPSLIVSRLRRENFVHFQAYPYQMLSLTVQFFEFICLCCQMLTLMVFFVNMYSYILCYCQVTLHNVMGTPS